MATTMSKTARKSYEIARLFAEGAEARGVVRHALGLETTIPLSDRQAEWLMSVAEREGGHYQGDGITSNSWRGGPADPKTGDRDISFTLWRRGRGWVMSYHDADPAIVAAKNAAREAANTAWNGGRNEDD